MTHQTKSIIFDEVIETIISQGLDGLGDAYSMLLNEAMKIERSRAIGAVPWERIETRRGYSNGYKDKSV